VKHLNNFENPISMIKNQSNKAFIAHVRSSDKATQTVAEHLQEVAVFWTRFLFSCQIDADRINSADFEIPKNTSYRNKPVSRNIAINRLELFLTK